MVYDVIIAGAGPVGLFLACELRLAKLSVLVLEQLEDPHSPLKRLPFGMRGLWGPSIEAFYRRGLLEQIASQPSCRRRCALASRDLDPWRPDRSAAGRPATSRASSSTTATSIRRGGRTDSRARPTPNWGPRWSISSASSPLTRSPSESRSSAAMVSKASRLRTMKSPSMPASNAFARAWLVGCDGGRSTVRKQGGFEFVGTEPEFTGYSVQVEIADPSILPLGRHSHADRHVHAVAAGGDRDCRLRRRRIPSRPNRSRASTCKRSCGACPART